MLLALSALLCYQSGPKNYISERKTTETTMKLQTNLSQALNTISDPAPLSSTLSPRLETRFAIRSGISQFGGIWNLIVICNIPSHQNALTVIMGEH